MCVIFDPRIQRITSLAVTPASEVARFAYDDDDLLLSAEYDPDGTAANGDEHELKLVNDVDNGLLTGTEMFDNAATPVKKITDGYLYNGFGEMAEYSASYLAGERFKTVFERDKLGRITKKTETLSGSAVSQIFEYEYDAAGRLEIVKEGDTNTTPTVAHTYVYDLNSNRESIDGGATVNATYDDQDRLEKFTPAGGPEWTYKYTANGELERKYETLNQSSTEIVYDYDVLGNLRGVDFVPGTSDDIEYIIDGRNRRIGKKVGGTLEQQWLYKDQLNPIAELDGAGNITKRFIYASRANVPDVMVIPAGLANAGTYRIISDHLGSPRFVIDTTSGNTVQALDYDEWGNVLSDTFPGFQPFAFAGGIYDSATGLTRFGARDYDPQIGRWTSKDPIRFGGRDVNLFGYAFSNPVNAQDFSGLAPGGFGERPLDSSARKLQSLTDDSELADELNLKFVHEAYIPPPSNGDRGVDVRPQGFHPDGFHPDRGKITVRNYTRYRAVYDDDVIQKAIRSLTFSNYNLVTNNCQHAADEIRQKYQEIMDEEVNSFPESD